MDKTLRAAAATFAADKERAAIRYNDESRLRLLKILEKKLTTAFIGALAKFEAHFGVLWGHGKREADLTQNERSWRARFEQARQEVLNNGNNQVRAVQQEIQQYTVKWNRFQATLIPIEGRNEKDDRD